MGFKLFLEEKDIEDELKDTDFDSLEIEPVEVDDDESVEDDDIEDVMDIDDDGEAENEEELEESTKSANDILTNRYKKKSRKLILDKMTKGAKVTPKVLAMFHTNFEFIKKMGRFGRWMRRKNKSEFKKKNPIAKLVKGMKKKAKLMRRKLKQGAFKKKQQIGSRKTQIKLGKRDVDAKGRVITK